MRWWGTLLIVAAVAVAAAEAQRGGRFRSQIRVAEPGDFDGRFQFCRVAYGSGRGGRGGGWGVDFPQADTNLSIRLSDLTRAPVSVDANRDPNHLVVRLTDDTLFQCPFIMMTEVGSIYLED